MLFEIKYPAQAILGADFNCNKNAAAPATVRANKPNNNAGLIFKL
jgi:hypothetical protein